ncbi:CAP1 [Symbiodinium natans]|uniref:CAP1 protein n=1 Tax=Symbiodinium natans TaxID=878477 RepID=A0A812P6C2_9DINO|nr:CAP1 [Symbiodinium natans]
MASLDMAQFETILKRLEAVAERLEGTPAPAGGSSGAGEDDLPPLVLAFDAYLQSKLAPAEAAAKAVEAQDVTEAMDSYMQGLRLLRELLLAAARCKKPQDTDWQGILKPVMELGSTAQKACDPRSDFFQHRKACAESLNVIMLVTSPSPPGHVQSVLETFDFHAMKVMQKKVDKETAWIKALKETLKELKEWCTENCKLGLIWNAQGQAAVDYFAASPLGSGGAAAAGGAATPAPKSKGKGKGPAMPKGGLAPMPEEVRAKLRVRNSGKFPCGALVPFAFLVAGGSPAVIRVGHQCLEPEAEEGAPAAKAPAGAGMSAAVPDARSIRLLLLCAMCSISDVVSVYVARGDAATRHPKPESQNSIADFHTFQAIGDFDTGKLKKAANRSLS